MMLSGTFLLGIALLDTATFALIWPINAETGSHNPKSVKNPIKRQLVIQTNSGRPIIAIHPPNRSNGTKPMVPNMIITQGPTNFLSQPINAILTFLTSSLSAFNSFLTSAARNQEEATRQEFSPIIIIPQITILFPSAGVETVDQSEVFVLGESIQEMKNEPPAMKPYEGDEGPIHAIVPILGNEANLEEHENSNSEKSAQELKRRRVFEDEKPNVVKETDRIVNLLFNSRLTVDRVYNL